VQHIYVPGRGLIVERNAATRRDHSPLQAAWTRGGLPPIGPGAVRKIYSFSRSTTQSQLLTRCTGRANARPIDRLRIVRSRCVPIQRPPFDDRWVPALSGAAGRTRCTRSGHRSESEEGIIRVPCRPWHRMMQQDNHSLRLNNSGSRYGCDPKHSGGGPNRPRFSARGSCPHRRRYRL